MFIAVIVLVLAVFFAAHFSRNKPVKKKFLIWGIATIFFISPLLSWMAGILFGMSVGDGFAGLAIMVYSFVFLLVIGFILLYFGIFKN
ncbi:hypothetical protein ACIQ34_08845 [Ureibacillus sp. NPDC094379]